MQPIDRIRRMQANYNELAEGSSEEYREALPTALRDLAWCVAFAVACAEFLPDDTLTAIFHRTEALMAAGRTISRAAQRERVVG
jgi:hypothetical protein